MMGSFPDQAARLGCQTRDSHVNAYTDRRRVLTCGYVAELLASTLARRHNDSTRTTKTA